MSHRLVTTRRSEKKALWIGEQCHSSKETLEEVEDPPFSFLTSVHMVIHLMLAALLIDSVINDRNMFCKIY